MNAHLITSIQGIMGFTEADLIANRDGKLNDAQYQKLRARRQGSLMVAGGAVIIAVILFVGILFENSLKSSDKPTIIALVCLALAVALLYVWLKWSQYTNDLNRGVAFAAEGELKLITYQSRGNQLYQYRVNQMRFRADKVLFDLLTDLAEDYSICAVYYAPQSHILLAFEPLDKNMHYKN